MSRLDRAFATARAEGRLAIMPYLMAGFPDRARTRDMIRTVAAAGADLLELGVPFSDPIADGPVIRAASHRALADGTTLAWTLAELQALRAEGLDLPIVLMGYCNPFLAYGLDRLARDAAGLIDAMIVPDLSAEDAGPWRDALARTGIGLVGFVAPTTPRDRVAIVLQSCTAFLYAVAVRGTTGARDRIAEDLPTMLARVREVTDRPLCVGFGISTPTQVAELKGHADGVIFASAMLAEIAQSPDKAVEIAGRFVADMRRAA
jgi:tryptophan synthase alpha chain